VLKVEAGGRAAQWALKVKMKMKRGVENVFKNLNIRHWNLNVAIVFILLSGNRRINQKPHWSGLEFVHNFWFRYPCWRRSQWPRSVRRRSEAARLLGLWFRIPPRTWMSVVCVVCCQVEVSATGWSLVQRSPTGCGASLCVI